ncbi:hypothetical protein PIB30_115610, partial [Stylosanthes scabra]|nr:hypothetical protein [Stylosanthes scabra]
MKFPTRNGVATVHGDQKIGRKCYNESLDRAGGRQKEQCNMLEIGRPEGKEIFRPLPEGELEDVQ